MNETLREGTQVGVEARWNKALQPWGDLDNGWENYEARGNGNGFRPGNLTFHRPSGRGRVSLGSLFLSGVSRGLVMRFYF